MTHQRYSVELIRAALQDPAQVHAAMLRGEIAKPDIRSMLHVYGAEALAKWDAADAAMERISTLEAQRDEAFNEGIEAAAKACDDAGDWEMQYAWHFSELIRALKRGPK
jgi:hypothetical protein